MVGPFCLPSFGSGFRVQGSRLSWRLRRLFYWGDARKWHLSRQSLVTPTIRGKELSHMCGMRSFGSVLTCSGWGFSRIERFHPLRMTIREGGRALIWEIRCVFWELAVLYYNTSSSLAKGRAKGAGWIHEAV